MEIFQSFLDLVAGTPDLVALILCPALLLVLAVALVLLKAKDVYLPSTVLLGAADLFLMACRADLALAVQHTALFVLLAALLRFLFFIPFRGKGRDRSEEMYNKFRVELDLPEQEETREGLPVLSEEESGLQLAHVRSLLERLNGTELDASDRLEADSISRALDVYHGKCLTEEELRRLNDCLVSALRLTAKYKL